MIKTHWSDDLINWEWPDTVAAGDASRDGRVDGSDVTILAGNWQHNVTAAATTVPEPSIMLILATLLTTAFIARVRKTI